VYYLCKIMNSLKIILKYIIMHFVGHSLVFWRSIVGYTKNKIIKHLLKKIIFSLYYFLMEDLRVKKIVKFVLLIVY